MNGKGEILQLNLIALPLLCRNKVYAIRYDVYWFYCLIYTQVYHVLSV